jgi:hypothetical protein
MIDMIRRLLQNKGRVTTPKRRSTAGKRRTVLKGRTACGVIATAMLLTSMLGGCIADQEFTPTPPAGDREVAFTVTVPGMKAPSTRALDATKEQEIAEIDVVIFENTGGTLVEYHRTTDITEVAPGGDWRFSVGSIKNSSNITATIIANASREVLRALRALEDTSGSNGSYIGASKSEFLKELYSTNEGKWNTSNNGYWKIPMYGEVSVANNRDIYDNLSSNVSLTRMLAKVDVVNGKHPKNAFPAAGDFRLTAVHVVHYNACGMLAPTWDSTTGEIQPVPSVPVPNTPTDPRKVVWMTDGDELTYDLSVDQGQLMSEIYLFECQAQSNMLPGASNPKKEMRLVFEGDYYTSATEHGHYFYPVDFNEEDGKTYIPLLRNNRYYFTIKEVTGQGHDKLGEAVATMGVVSNLKTSLLVVDESGIRNIVWNGEYFLGIEKEEVTLDAAVNSTVSINCLTNYAAGWLVDRIEWGSTGSNWLSAVLASVGNPNSDLVLTTNTANSGASDRVATVHLKAGRLTHKITVTQQQFPSIALRFARSNIVWDAANSRLTFATTEAENVTIPANVQGVFFKWGSLVAISPTGTSANYNASQILFSANGTKNYTWANVPYINETIAPFNDSDLNSDDFATYNGNSGYNASTNKGDICRYITAQGWVPSGERWRLPKQSELDALIAETTSVGNNGGFGSITSPNTPANVNGFWQVPSGRWLGKGAATAGTSRGTEQVPGVSSVYFPAGGNRGNTDGSLYNAGRYAYSWSGSSEGTVNAYDLYVNSISAGRDSGGNRNYGFSVRCIRE